MLQNILDMQLHVFNRTLELALASVSYFTITSTDNTVEVKFNIEKARVGPLKKMATANVELEAATNEAKLAKFVKEQHIKVNSTTPWTDSTTVLHWINSPNQLHRKFLANRINFIFDSTSQKPLEIVSSKINNFDDGTWLQSMRHDSRFPIDQRTSLH